MYEERRQQVIAALKENGIDKAIIGDPISVFYLSGIRVTPFERFYGMVLEDSGAYMIVPALDRGCMKNTMQEVTYEDATGPEPVILRAVADCKVLGVEKGYFSIHWGECFTAGGAELKEIAPALAMFRMYKSRDELDKMQHAADITDAALEHIKKLLHPGMSEKEVNQCLYQYMLTCPGYTDEEKVILVQAGKNSANPHGASTDYRIQKGDVILMDFGALYGGYWSDITRCVFMGEAPEVMIEIYEIVKRANEAAIKAVRPGVTAEYIDQVARTVIADAGYGEYFLHRTGHGLGLSVHEEPYIRSGNTIVLQEGMTFTIEPGIYLEGTGGIRIEDDIVVTADGCRVLTHTSKNLQII